ncbi:transposase InsO family protein [Pseudomonas sp. F-14 TE3623]
MDKVTWNTPRAKICTIASLKTGYSGDDIRDLMLESMEKRFGDQLPTTPVQWLSDNGSAYTAEQTRLFARQIGLQPVTTPVRSPQSNGMAENFVKTIKRDYVAHMPKPDRETALRNLAIAFEHYNEQHPHSALNYLAEGVQALGSRINLTVSWCPIL